MADEPRNILIIKPSAIGDIILALPALGALRKSFPRARISWLVRTEYADLLREHPYVDEVILFDRRLLGGWWYSPKAFGELRGLIRRLKEAGYDLVFDFQGLFRTGFLAWVTGCGRRYGQAGAREFAPIFYTHKIPQDYSCIHLADYYLKMTVEAGANPGEIEFKLPDVKEESERVKNLLIKEGIRDGNYAVMIPSAARAEKIWPIEKFGELADRIAGESGLSIVATGSKGEREYIDTLGRAVKTRVLNLAGETTLRELIALLKGAKLVVSNDTGPGHIAAAAGVAMVMIFGPTNPARLAPYHRPKCLAAVEATGMGMKIDSFDPKYEIGHITVEQVFEKALQQLS